jgi:ABC-type multidrug transport system fused ATPase/permease subunit
VKDLKQILKYMRGYGKECVLGPLFKLLEASFELMIPLVVARIVDIGIEKGDTGYIVKMCILMVLFVCLLGGMKKIEEEI